MILSSLQEFYSFFENNKPIIAIDYGAKKIGLAISSPDYLIAMPYLVISNAKDSEKITKILDVILKNKVCGIVIGLPVNMDGTDSKQTTIVKNFATNLAKKTLLPLYLQDERLTSKLADNLLKNMGFNRKKRNEIDDVLAASLILETTLEAIKRL